MIRPSYSKIFVSVFGCYINLIMWLHFRKIVISGTISTKHCPVIYIANHISWWDGFIAYKVNKKLFKKKLFVMMLENQLSKHKWFRYGGAFSVNPGSKSVVESLEFASTLLVNNNHMLAVFPQGEIHTQQHRSFRFKEGIEHILKNKHNVCIVFAAVMTDYLNHRKPSLYVYIYETVFSISPTAAMIEEAYRTFYQFAVQKHDIAV